MIYFTGDTHIPMDITKLNSKNFSEQKSLTKNDYVIICGDFGGVWDGGREEMYWRRWLNDKKFTTLFVDGNHENFNLLSTFEVVDFHGGKAHKISDSIYHLMRGEVYHIDGKKLFTFGGASSHDKKYRTENVSWWKEELPSEDEIERARKNLELNDWKIDYIITHSAPTSIQREISSRYEENILTDFFEEVKNRAEFIGWLFGHYHMDVVADNKYVCLFESIIKI